MRAVSVLALLLGLYMTWAVEAGGPVVSKGGVPALVQGNQMDRGQSMKIGPYTLLVQADCNLVLYKRCFLKKQQKSTHSYKPNHKKSKHKRTRRSKLVPVWASGTQGRGSTACHLNVQADGNVVLYDGATGPAVWATGSKQDLGPNLVSILILSPKGFLQLGVYIMDPPGSPYARFVKALWYSNSGAEEELRDAPHTQPFVLELPESS